VDGKYHNFGTYPSLSVAQHIRNILEENNWIIPFQRHTIFQINNQYHVVCNVTFYKARSPLLYRGSATDYESALRLSENPLGEKHITRQSKGYVLNKRIKGNTCTYGYFTDHDVAYAMRDYLILCDWQLPRHNNPYIIHIKDKYYQIRIEKGNIKVLSYSTSKDDLQEDDMSNIYKTKTFYSISRVVGKQRENYLTYNTIEEAKSMRKYLREHDWNKEDFLKEYNRRYPSLPKYIYKENGKYIVRRRWKGVHKHYGAYLSLKEAISRVEYLEKHNWQSEVNLNIVNYDGVFYVYKNIIRGYATPFRAYYYKTEDKDDALSTLEQYKLEGFPEPYLVTNKYRYVIRNRNLFYVFFRGRKLCYARSMSEALVARDLCEWLGMVPLSEGVYVFDGQRYVVSLNSWGTPVFERVF
jgi:hypothetical protein